jgi:hypothetical protein
MIDDAERRTSMRSTDHRSLPQAEPVPLPTQTRQYVLSTLFLYSALALLAVLYVTFWLSLLKQPALGGVDFLILYTAGRIFRFGELPRLYNLELQQRIQTPIVGPDFVPGGPLPFNHPPYMAPLLGVIAVEDYTVAFVGWSVLLLLTLVLCGWVVASWMSDGGWRSREAWLAGAGCLLFYPVFISVLKGQDTAFVLLGLLLWGRTMAQGRNRWAGLALALVTMRPQIALALALPTLFARPRAFGWFAAGSAALGLYTLLLIGWDGCLEFFHLLRVSASGEGLGMNQAAMYNLLGTLLRAIPYVDHAALRVVAWSGFLAGIGLLCWRWRRCGPRLDAQEIGLAVVLAVFLSPHLHYHDLSLLVVPAVGGLLALTGRCRRPALPSLTLVPAASLVLFAGNLAPAPWPYVSGLAVMLALAAGLAASLRPMQVEGAAPRD